MSIISQEFTARDAGQLLARNKAIDKRLESLNIAFQNADSEECPYLLGKISGLVDSRSVAHRKLVSAIVKTKQEMEEAVDFNEEQAYLKGYLHGIEIVLQIDRELYEQETNFIFFLYSESRDLLEKYLLAFRSVETFSELNGHGLQYYISADAVAISAEIERYKDGNQFLVAVLYDSEHLPSVSTMRTLAADRQQNIYLHKDSNEENAEKIIYKFLKKTCT